MIIREDEKFGFKCRCAYPNNFDENKKYPMLFFLHGAGEAGENTALLEVHGPLKEIKFGREYDAIIVAPQRREGTWFDKFESLQSFVDYFAKLPFVDQDRVYLSGISMGGYGSWQLLMSKPDIFAGAIICCGGGMNWNAEAIRHIPVWAFHGVLDVAVPVELSVRMVNAINYCGGEAHLTVYEDLDHDCWTRTFANDKVYEWLFSKKRGEEVQCVIKDE